MPLLQTPGPAPDFTAHAYFNNTIGNIGLQDYKVKSSLVLCSFKLVLYDINEFLKETKNVKMHKKTF